MSAGSTIEIFKEKGLPRDVVRRFDLADMAGSHAIGHTRMATESAVTTEHSHPFSTGLDLCLVHNGSLSNHNRLRQVLRREGGIDFQTDNDSEVAAGYLTWRMGQGASLHEALEAGSPTSTASTPSASAPGTASRSCATRSPASTRCWPRPTTGWRWRPNTAPSPVCPEPRRPRSGSRRPAQVYSWGRA